MSELMSWLAILAGGLIVTVKLSVFTTILTIVWSALLAICAISPWRPVRATAALYTDLFRSIPLLALLTFVFFGLGRLLSGFGISAFWVAVASLTINESAYLGEIYRGTLLSIPQPQWEAGSSLGLGWPSIVRLVIVPQVLMPAVPSTLNLSIGTIKNSSLASLVAVNEVTLAATILVSQTFEPMKVYLVLSVLYLALILPISLLARWLERRVGASVAITEEVYAPAAPRPAPLPRV
jgi:polar amino acid transport system permease protein